MSTAASPYSAQGAQKKLKETLSRLDVELSKYKYANDFEQKTGVPKSYVALGAAGVVFLMIFFNFAGQLLTNTISWLYPGKYVIFRKDERTHVSYFSLCFLQGH